MDLYRILSIITEWDPVSLITSNLLTDEYICEATTLNEYIESKNISVKELSVKIYDVFIDSFGSNCFSKSIEECEYISKKIIGDIRQGTKQDKGTG